VYYIQNLFHHSIETGHGQHTLRDNSINLKQGSEVEYI